MVHGSAERDKVLDVVRKLLRLAGNNDKQGEIEAALAKATQVLAKHGLSMADVGSAEETTNKMNIMTGQSPEKSQFNSYEMWLATAVGHLFSLKPFMTKGSMMPSGYRKVIMNFVGETTDVAIGMEIWPWLCAQAANLARDYNGKGWNPNHRMFAEGFASRVLKRSIEAAKLASQGQKSDFVAIEDANRFALVLATKQDAIQKYLESEGMRLRDGRRRSNTGGGSADSWMAGDSAGRKVNLSFKKGMTDNSRTLPG